MPITEYTEVREYIVGASAPYNHSLPLAGTEKSFRNMKAGCFLEISGHNEKNIAPVTAMLQFQILLDAFACVMRGAYSMRFFCMVFFVCSVISVASGFDGMNSTS